MKHQFLISILATLVLIWCTNYPLHMLPKSLFTSIIGLSIITVLSFIIDWKVGIIAIIFCSFCIFTRYNNEGFSDIETSFKQLITSIRPTVIYNFENLKTQTTPVEIEYFNKYEIWPWTPKVDQLYINSSMKNINISMLPEISLLEAKKIYNQNNILKILASQSKEYSFLTNGVSLSNNSNSTNSFADEAGLYEASSTANTLVKCNSSLNPVLEQSGYSKTIDYNTLEEIIPDFSFVKNKCNPCVALGNIPDINCPFKIGDGQISPIWKYLWGI